MPEKQYIHLATNIIICCSMPSSVGETKTNDKWIDEDD